MPPDPRLVAEINGLAYPSIYATLCGDTLYGIPSTELDLRGCHAIPAREAVSLRPPPDSIAGTVHRDGLDFEYCSHEFKKLCQMLLKKNGCVAEQVLSPHVVQTSEAHAELCEIVPLCYSRHMAHHFQSQARLHWQVANGRSRGLLYAFRVLLSGIHLMRARELVSDLPELRERFDLPWLDDLLAAPEADASVYGPRHEKLTLELVEAAQASALPAAATEEGRARLDDLLVRLRMR